MKPWVESSWKRTNSLQDDDPDSAEYSAVKAINSDLIIGRDWITYFRC